jgi:nucleotide-binding universal stress UspA family protein
MAIRDILLQLNSYPEPTPDWAIKAAVRLAGQLDSRLSAALCRVHIPDLSNALADKLTGAGAAIARENERSCVEAERLDALFAAQVPGERLGERLLIECRSMVQPRPLAWRARTRDLIIVPSYGHPETEYVAEVLIFDSGRPVLLLPQAGFVAERLERIVVGWDGGRAAARALAEALPLLAAAREVSLVGVTGDKVMDEAPAAEVLRHLGEHGIIATATEIGRDGADAGTALMRHAAGAEADLLVMGGYGHSRLREFVLGGATRAVLSLPIVPVLLAH